MSRHVQRYGIITSIGLTEAADRRTGKRRAIATIEHKGTTYRIAFRDVQIEHLLDARIGDTIWLKGPELSSGIVEAWIGFTRTPEQVARTEKALRERAAFMAERRRQKVA